MTGYLYSATARAFYHGDVHAADVIPEDARAVTRRRHAELMAAQAEGKAIVPNGRGNPVIAAQPKPSDEAVLASLRARRDRLLRESDHSQMPDYPMSAEARAAWASYRQALRDLPMTAKRGAVEWPAPPQE